ncbi:modifier of mdg4-like isoform X7 [Drosophila pseudoobscura]|uniref:Modifier of mdg4-like isoform X7 n=1 Tax=Drosophila pseudoobscura pseudoobscura TaxID=46245 RepID=A0A6I8V5F3_DROPS|nr:modifier of mdg4 isoform X7 [Drosophila pseudoobscura]
MADDEQFSLCWNNFNTNLSAGFHESLIRGDLVDVSLVAEGQIVKAHRLVLSVCSPLFRKMFTNMPLNTHAFVYLNNVSHSALKDLIQFMYCGEVNVKQDALPAFISTAESLQIKGLTDNDPAPPPPQEPSPPPAPAPIVQQQPPQPVPAQRVQRQQPRASARYKIETVDDGLGDDNKGTTQIVIQTSAPQAIVQQAQQQQQHIQTQQMQTGTTTTATLVSTNKRAAQRSSLTGGVKRSKTTATTASANIIDPLDSGAETATTSTAQLVPQQITVQTVSAAESKLHPQQLRQQAQQQQQQQEEAEYIDLPMELPTKAEPEYSEDHGDAAGDGDATYVEDDTYGDMRYDDSYFTENEDAGPQAPANTSGNSATATTSKAVVKTQTYSDSSFVDTSADPGNTEAQDDVASVSVPKSLPKKVTKEAKPLPEDVNTSTVEKSTKKPSDAIPLYDGCPVLVSKAALARAYIPMPAIYASRVTDLVIGKEMLMKIAQGKDLPDEDLLHAIITHVCQVFAIRGEELTPSIVQKYIEHKLSTLKAIVFNAKD